MSEFVLVLDFGGQYKELIARAVRKLSVYSQILPGATPAAEIGKMNPIGIILTGGPNSVYAENAPKCDPELFSLGIPVLGICYGMQMTCHMLGGQVAPGDLGEYGRVPVKTIAPSPLFEGADAEFPALMSHRDVVSRLPEGFFQTASTAGCIAACENPGQRIYGVQFHPESEHTQGGLQLLERFLYGICGASGSYKLDDYIDTQIRAVRKKVGDQKILLALSGGVDSSVCAALLSKAVPGQLTCVFVDHGFMRLHEGDEVERVFSAQDLTFIRVNAQDRFLKKIKGVSDPEQKRKIVGREFVQVFQEKAEQLGSIPFLAQGTIYPDIVESGGTYGAVIKSHHNVGGLPETLSFTEVIEPLSSLFKDEVCALGRKLGLPSSIVDRQPFPGPGLSIRIVGEVTAEKLELLRKADAILREELDKSEARPDQYFAVLTNTCSVGVKGDDRTYDPVVALRAVVTSDFMTCEYAPLPHQVLGRISQRITGEVSGISRIVYDITSKPPATVEWE